MFNTLDDVKNHLINNGFSVTSHRQSNFYQTVIFLKGDYRVRLIERFGNGHFELTINRKQTIGFLDDVSYLDIVKHIRIP